MRRVRRRPEDRQHPEAGHWQRLHCTAADCGHEMLALRRGAYRLLDAQHPPLRAVLAGLALLLGIGTAAALGLQWAATASVAYPARIVPGEHSEGEPLPAGHPLLARAAVPSAEQPLVYRQACLWGKPGHNPYRGSVHQALVAAHLPAEVVAALVQRIGAHTLDERALITNAGIVAQSSGRVFRARGFAMTYAHTMCVDTRVNYPQGHTEPADLYDATDRQGRHYAVMVPDVCGNLSILADRRQAADAARLPAAIDPGGLRPAGDHAPAHEVPEPSSLWLSLLGLVAARALRRARRARS